MTKRTLIACMAAIGIAAGTGCTTVIKYDLANLSTTRPDSKRQAMRVAVAPLQDMRSAEEKDPQNSTYFETRDRIFEGGDVARGISAALVTHFNHVQLFKTTELVDKSAGLPPPTDVAEKMKGLGFDALFTGTVKHFYGAGHPTAFDRAATILALIPVTVIVTLPIMLVEDNQNEGFVEIVDVRLTDTKSGGVLWSGTFSKKRNMYYYDADPVRAASETLREIADEIVKQIEVTDMK